MVVQPHPILGPPIDVRQDFGPERARLLHTLQYLDDEGWQTPTPCLGWSVHDVASHVLGADIGRLARTRDDFTGVTPSDGEVLPQFIDRINHEWVVAARRMSPRLLVSSLAWTGEQVAELWNDMSHDEMGEPVSWAGPGPAPAWLDAARDLTEYWVHRQQILEALGHQGPKDPATLHTVIDTFMRALPHTLRNQMRPVGTGFSFVVPGRAGGVWTVERQLDGWRLTDQTGASNAVVLEAEQTWRLCVRMLTPETAERHAEITGDHDLARAALQTVSIIRSD